MPPCVYRRSGFTTHSSRQAAFVSTPSSPVFSTVKLSHLLNGPAEMSCCSFSMSTVSLLTRLLRWDVVAGFSPRSAKLKQTRAKARDYIKDDDRPKSC